MRGRSYDSVDVVQGVPARSEFDRDEAPSYFLSGRSSFVTRRSAGLLMYRRRGDLEVFLVHPGGPHFAKKDLGAWGIPKGEYLDGEEPLQAAVREFQEETGFT